MNLWHDVSLGKNAPSEINMIVETPRGSLNKYEIDKETGVIALDRVLYAAMPMPLDYGFAPQTLWDDGDAIDVVALSTEAFYPGILIPVRPVALMHMIDSGEQDDKVIVVPVKDPRWETAKDLSDLNPHLVKTFKHFFENYKTLQNKVVTIPGFEGAEAARKAILRGQELYRQKFH